MTRHPTELSDLPLGVVRVIYRKNVIVVIIMNEGLVANPWGSVVRAHMGRKSLRKYWVVSFQKSHVEIDDNNDFKLLVREDVFTDGLKFRTFDDFELGGTLTCAVQSFQRLGGSNVKHKGEAVLRMHSGLKDDDDTGSDAEDTSVRDDDPDPPPV